MLPGRLQMTHFIVILEYQPSKKLKEFKVSKVLRLEDHPNNPAANFMKARGIARRLERKRPIDLLN